MENKTVYLIGKDLSCSASYKIHEAVYNYIGVNYKYCNLEFADVEELKSYLDNLDLPFFVSNITYPYKHFILKYFKQLNFWISPEAEFAGGCNFINLEQKKLYNFDGWGLKKFLEINNHKISQKSILICGSGVTAHSIYYSLGNANAKISIASRTGNNNKIHNLNYVSYDLANQKLNDFDIVIDATPLGIRDKPLLEIDNFSKKAIIVDVTYGKEQSNLIMKSKNKGLVAYDGSGMLVCQAIFCIQELFKTFNLDNNHLNDFKKLYNLSIDSLRRG